MRTTIVALAMALTFHPWPSRQQSAAKTVLNTTPQVKETPVFHGLKLGFPLGSQLKKCIRSSFDRDRVDGKWDEFCFYDPFESSPGLPSDSMIVWLLHGMEKISTDGHNAVGLLMPIVSRDAASGTIESVTLHYDMSEASRILGELKAKYAEQPFCEEVPMRTGIGIPINSTSCSWEMPWGVVLFHAPREKIDRLQVTVFTNRFLEHQAEIKKKEKPEF